MINDVEAKKDAGCRMPRLAGEKPAEVSPVGAGAFRVWHEIHAEGLVMAMIADCWTCGDAWERFVPQGCYLWYVPLIVAVILLYTPDGGWLSGLVTCYLRYGTDKPLVA